MSLVTTKTSLRLAGFSAGCDRLVHPTVTEAGERGRQRRLIGVMLVAPFLIGAAAVHAFAGQFGAAALLVGLCALFGAGWMGALVVAAAGRRTGIGAIALASGSVAVGSMLAAAGGAGSPLALLVFALAFEPYWVDRSRRSALWGCAAAATALAVGVLAGATFPPLGDVSAPSAAQWLAPLGYAAAVWLRLGPLPDQTSADAAADADVAVEDLLDAVVMRLNASGDIQDVSAQSRRILNLPPELLLGSGLFERVHVADRLAYLTALADLREGATALKVELRLRLPSLAVAQPAVGYLPFSVEFSRPAIAGHSTVAVIRDNSEIAGLREAVVCAEDRAENDDLAKSRFLATVSHELRTPLNAIIGFSDMLLHEIYGGFTDPRQKEYAGLIRESGNHLLSVVNSILDVSKIESGVYAIHPEPFRFADAAAMCRSMMAHQAEAKSIELEERVAPNAGEIRGDRRAIQQILINLVSNAVKFTPNGGQVTIGAKRLGSRLIFWVSDNGIGIAEEDLARLGQPFMQVQNDYTRRYDGTGLGLSLVKGLVTLHEGSMSIESAPDLGTTVTVSLPCDGPVDVPAPADKVVALAADGQMEANDEALRKTA